MHRSEGDSSISLHKRLVEECIERLRKLRPSAIAIQGTRLLSALLTEAKQAPRLASTSRKRAPLLDLASRNRRKKSKITKFVDNPSSNSGGTRTEPHSVPAQNFDATAEDAGDHEEGFELMGSRVPQILPPQAGFSNDFLFNELLDLWI
jgi:hypothetical protein